MNKTITLAKGGEGERSMHIDQIVIPDLWHVANRIRDGRMKGTKVERNRDADFVIYVWHLAHDLKRHIQEAT